MSAPINKDKQPRSPRVRRGPAPSGGTSPARRRAAIILEVLAGVRRPSEAAEALGASLPRYYQMERQALLGLLAACEPAPRGPRVDPAKQLATLERENQRLKRECDRQQALVRMAERSLGLPSPPVIKPAASGKESSRNGMKRRRARRARVRALQVAHGLRSDDAAGETQEESVALASG